MFWFIHVRYVYSSFLGKVYTFNANALDALTLNRMYYTGTACIPSVKPTYPLRGVLHAYNRRHVLHLS